MNELLIRNVQLLDGTGAQARPADVAIDGGRISAVTGVGGAGAARREIDGAGACLAPGFIDTHAHDDGAFFRHPGMEFKLAQGVTTVVCGNCGFSAVPADPAMDASVASGGILAGLAGEFTDLDGYFAAALARRPAINNMMLVGHNTVRTLVMGAARRAPTASELASMRAHVRTALEQGACGFSTGLIYRPGRYSATEEVIELAKEAQPFDALYTTHMRNEGDRLLEAVEESLEIGIQSGVHLHISHHKAAGERNWGKVEDSLARVDVALAAGQRVTLDVYPYTAGSGRMIEYFDLDNVNQDLARVIRIASCPAFREFEGRMLVDIAAERGIEVTEAVRLVLTAPKGDRTLCIQFVIDEADVETNLAHADMMIGSDGIPDLRGMPHPRLFGTFPRILGRYVRERGLLSLPEGCRLMPAASTSSSTRSPPCTISTRTSSS
jgi:N-acyl-D-aspartate/D-glutamate deacylase